MEYYSSLDASKLDQETPTLFELISANQLEALLSPSLRYVLVHYAQRYPGYLLKITNKFDEINLLLRTLVEWYFFKYWRGSFTENFYGIKRVSQTPLSSKKYNASKLTQLTPSMIEERRDLSRVQSLVSIFEVTGLSYLREKLNYQYELLYSKLITNQLNATEATSTGEARYIKLQLLFVRFYPFVQFACKFSNLITTLLYLSGSCKSPSLLTFLFKVNYARLNQYDYSRNEPSLSSDKSSKLDRVNPPSNLERFANILKDYVAKPSLKLSKIILGTIFPIAIFSLKFLEWWNNSNFAQTVAKSQRNDLEEPIPPPSLLKALFIYEQNPAKFFRANSSCPLCKDEIHNPAIIETGHVFCYTCIFNYLRDSHKLVRMKKAASENGLSSEEEPEQEKDDTQEKRIYSKSEPGTSELFFIDKGGRCPITGQKLLGCKWNEVTGEFDV
ncbi:hypothetical protein METBIDRAFT_44945 [Metschnikowia bicuspidata var. bicuspidata NRRL YB-4993]|uniref:Peroxisome assembly protein 12 n=1 Tax=Metschnikowia bicuspidata var. bicuspidata NRRL YB-4993 TaxID=869754 RepID=A0A1A0H872_9ASCO|nr:hypothetical protein METBIDRAFT_44945 [Metschnikowia bicuspidata var. bicuspidata NRRL YB-4993]OBA20093.1 hypothetical protein METBIDRAFT_44945 [Metschnikowia bicuspidata var. bicuspidata NRRL YB-4993]